jgi:hypothetical protein
MKKLFPSEIAPFSKNLNKLKKPGETPINTCYQSLFASFVSNNNNKKNTQHYELHNKTTFLLLQTQS